MTTMSHKLLSFIIGAFFAASVATAEDMFPGQPELSVAYDRVTEAVSTLNLALIKSGRGVTTAIGYLGEAKAQLETAAKNKGSACESAIKLISEAKQWLSGPTVTLPAIVKARDISKEALKQMAQDATAGK